MSFTGIGLGLFSSINMTQTFTHIENILKFTLYQEVKNQVHAYQLIINR
jgi:hypothetical protein